jgi:hypothetical protein
MNNGLKLAIVIIGFFLAISPVLTWQGEWAINASFLWGMLCGSGAVFVYMFWRTE